MFKELKEFALRGNVFDMAVGIIIGSAFGSIVKSLVDDMIMPPIGLLLGNVNFGNLFIVLKAGSTPRPYDTLSMAKEAGAVTMNYGLFINTIVNFLIVAIAMFWAIRIFNKLQQEGKPAPDEPTTKECMYCFTMIPIQAQRCPNCTSDL